MKKKTTLQTKKPLKLKQSEVRQLTTTETEQVVGGAPACENNSNCCASFGC